MSSHSSLQTKTHYALSWCFWAGNTLAWLTVLVCSFHPRFHWLQRLGYIAAIIFSTGNLVLVHRGKQQRAQLQGDEDGDTQK